MNTKFRNSSTNKSRKNEKKINIIIQFQTDIWVLLSLACNWNGIIKHVKTLWESLSFRIYKQVLMKKMEILKTSEKN